MAKEKVKLNLPVASLRLYIEWARHNRLDLSNAYEQMHHQVLLQIEERLWDYRIEKKGAIQLNPLELNALVILMYRWDFFTAPEDFHPCLALVHASLPRIAIRTHESLLPPPQTHPYYDEDE